MKIQLSDHFTYRRLFRFTLPSIGMMIFSSLYGIVDGLFVSNLVGKDAFTAVNFIMPVLMILGSLGFMIGTGGSALIAKTMGEGDFDKANRLFSFLVAFSIGLGVIIALGGYFLLPVLARVMGAEGALFENSVMYGRILALALPFYILQQEFQSFYATAEKPHLGLIVSLTAGCLNMGLDALFVAVFSWGLAGAAFASVIGMVAGGLFPLIYFALNRKGVLFLTRPVWDGRALLKTCTNGSSELLSNISFSLVGMLYNVQLLDYAGEDGVAAYGVLMYVSMIFFGFFMGYSLGTAPIAGCCYGAGDRKELRSLFRKSLLIIGVMSLSMFGLGELFARPLTLLFVRQDASFLSLSLHAFRVYSFGFLFAGLAIYGSGFFTALNNGRISALISFLRTLVFQVAAILVFPLLWQVEGIWLSTVAAELLAFLITAFFLILFRKKYGYGREVADPSGGYRKT